jgi:hypothetical protein
MEHALRDGHRGIGEDGAHLEAVGGGVEEAEAEFEVAGDGRSGLAQATLIGESRRDRRCRGDTSGSAGQKSGGGEEREELFHGRFWKGGVRLERVVGSAEGQGVELGKVSWIRRWRR